MYYIQALYVYMYISMNRNALYSHASVPYPSTIDFSGLDVEVARRDIYGLLHVAKMHDKLDEFLQNGMLCSLYISTLLQV